MLHLMGAPHNFCVLYLFYVVTALLTPTRADLDIQAQLANAVKPPRLMGPSRTPRSAIPRVKPESLPVPERATTHLLLGRHGDEATNNYRYLRLEIHKLREGATDTAQLSELYFFDYGNVRLQAVSIASNDTSSPGHESPENLIDGKADTKWVGFGFLANHFASVTVDFGKTVAVKSAQLMTGNDEPGRDPVEYSVAGSVDGTAWDLLAMRAAVVTEKRCHPYPVEALAPMPSHPVTLYAPNVGYTAEPFVGVCKGGKAQDMVKIVPKPLQCAQDGAELVVTGTTNAVVFNHTFAAPGLYGVCYRPHNTTDWALVPNALGNYLAVFKKTRSALSEIRVMG